MNVQANHTSNYQGEHSAQITIALKFNALQATELHKPRWSRRHQRWPESHFQIPTPLLLQNLWIRVTRIFWPLQNFWFTIICQLFCFSE